jgi:hypothetical protein
MEQEMKAFFLAVMFFAMCALGSVTFARETSHSKVTGIDADFRSFIREYLNNAEFQKTRTKFPLVHISRSGDESFVTRKIKASQWEKLSGPEHFDCKQSCFDSVVYDTFEKHPLRKTGQRVFSLEGVENGINVSLYFQLINGQWFLVRYEDLST